jgi:hypothetical protein
MILTKNVTVTISPRNYKHFKSLGYGDLNCGYNINVKLEDLNRGSNVIITCKCDNCGLIKNIKYKTYLKYNNEYDKYYCRKCSQVKLEITNIERYGTKYPLQNKDILKRRDKTVIEKYGVKNVSQCEEIKNKRINTNIEKYGYPSHLSNDEIKCKIRRTKLKKKDIETLIV